MATTPKNGLPLIDSSMTADVPRDMNALAGAVDTVLGDMASVPTTDKTAAGAISELFTSASNGKTAVAAAITGKGVPASASDTFPQLAGKIDSIQVGVDTGDATAVAADLRAGKTAYAKGSKVTGALAVQATGAQTITPGTADVVKGAGIYDGAITVKGDANLLSANIKAGKSIFGLAGSGTVVDTADAVLDPAFLLTGYSGYDDGVKKTGTMPNYTGQNIQGGNPWINGTTIYFPVNSGGYYPGAGNSGVYQNDPDFIAANILNTANIFGLQGTAKPLEFTAGDYVIASNNGTTSNTFSSWTKIRTFRIVIPGTYRVVISFNSGTGASVSARIYKNGAAYGTLRSTANTFLTVFKEDLLFSAGDSCEFWGYSGSGSMIWNEFHLDTAQGPYII